MHKHNEKQEEMHVKNSKRIKELQFSHVAANNAQMSTTQAQQASMTHPLMIKHS